MFLVTGRGVRGQPQRKGADKEAIKNVRSCNRISLHPPPLLVFYVGILLA